MKFIRITILETVNKVGQEVLLKGWVNARRNMGKIVFLDLRDFSGIAQVVGVPSQLDEVSVEQLKQVRPEWVVEIRGIVNERGEKQKNQNIPTGSVEVLAKEIKVLALAEPLPLDLEDEKIGLDVHLDYLPLTLRAPKWRAVFKIQGEIVEAFRSFLRSKGFTEFQCPKIVGASTEGGANVFAIDYFGNRAFLAQSPQFYKQIMVGVYERVFTVGNVYRAEEHATTRHLNEYTSLDLEMGMIQDHTDIMRLETEWLRYLISHLNKTAPEELKLWNFIEPVVPETVPSFKLKEVLQLIKERTGVDHTNEPDLEPNEERWIGDYVKEKFNSDFVFVTHYPTAKRPMYTYPDEADPDYTKSFDLLFRGIEVTTGGQRVNNYEQLVNNIKKWGLNPENFKFYLEAFQFGMPQEGGLAIGLERLTAKLLGIDNVKLATLFPRDLNRIDLQISPPEYKK
ncbi:MAG: Aspartyl-tRNA synthetase [Candidatus Magasanikbacteria bacterium GW2011_GWA2_46_17]|uniref:Aspartate--tRNA ligase n=1 Tax=Candidatus Magasanikbacteria bacterium GW2011_GWA2_46_17 TaxID=1619042 RepID=A0A0G1P3I7_9BACT|nr:MAG: Aspartyl-tRNA synthetase [Candidatus Magasanikbacteria bacterium GW2011_GWA2_46_17]